MADRSVDGMLEAIARRLARPPSRRGFLACCGGTHTSCPPGTEMSRVTWIGTCRHPVDGKDYIVSYNDCCGNSFCGRCMCNRNEGDRPVYIAGKSNDINWCMGTA